jgi:hypothetical protein
MKFFKFLFTARMSFILFAFLAFAFTLLVLAWGNRNQVRIVIQHLPTAQAR